MLHPQLVAVGMIVSALFLVSYSNKQLQGELDNNNRTLFAVEKNVLNRKKQMKACSKELQYRKDFITETEKKKKELTVKLNELEKEFQKWKPNMALLAGKKSETESLKSQLKIAKERESKERKNLKELQGALDQLAKKEEARNAKKAQQELKENKTPAPRKQGINAVHKKQ